MTDKVDPTIPQAPGGGRGDERLVRPEDLSRLNGGTEHAAAGGIWPVLTIVLATVASWMAVTLTFARAGIDPDLLAFHTTNVFWVLVTVGAPATLTIAVGAVGMLPGQRGSRALRVAAAAMVGAHLVVLAVIAVIQVVKEARGTIMAQTAIVSVAVCLAAVAVVLGFLAVRRARKSGNEPDSGTAGFLSIMGLICVLIGQAVLASSTVTLLTGAVGLYVTSLLVSTLTPVGSLTALWLVVRTRGTTAWTGAAVLCLLAVVAVGSLINLFTLGLPPLAVALQTVQVGFYVAAAVGAVVTARATSPGRLARGGSEVQDHESQL